MLKVQFSATTEKVNVFELEEKDDKSYKCHILICQFGFLRSFDEGDTINVLKDSDFLYNSYDVEKINFKIILKIILG